MARDGVDGEMISKVQNGVEHVKIADSPAQPVSNAKPTFYHQEGARHEIQQGHPMTPSSPAIDEATIKSPSGVRNMQESTLDKDGKLVNSVLLKLVAPAMHIFAPVLLSILLLPLCTHVFTLYFYPSLISKT